MSKQDIMWMIFVGIVCLLGIKDYKKKEISLILVGLGTILGGIFRGISLELVISLCPGLLLGGFSILSGEKIGLGDCLVIGMGAFFLSLENMLIWIFLSFFLAGIFGMIRILLFHKDKKEQIPFVPFLGISAVLTYLIQFMGRYENNV